MSLQPQTTAPGMWGHARWTTALSQKCRIVKFFVFRLEADRRESKRTVMGGGTLVVCSCWLNGALLLWKKIGTESHGYADANGSCASRSWIALSGYHRRHELLVVSWISARARPHLHSVLDGQSPCRFPHELRHCCFLILIPHGQVRIPKNCRKSPFFTHFLIHFSSIFRPFLISLQLWVGWRRFGGVRNDGVDAESGQLVWHHGRQHHGTNGASLFHFLIQQWHCIIHCIVTLAPPP